MINCRVFPTQKRVEYIKCQLKYTAVTNKGTLFKFWSKQMSSAPAEKCKSFQLNSVKDEF